MALHSGIDTVAFVSFGVYTKNYGSADDSNIASLFASRGFLEGAIDILKLLFRGRSRIGLSTRST